MIKHIISFKNATISQNKKVVLRDISFTLDPGAFVYLIGRTGTGKSTLKTLYGDIKLGEEKEVVNFDLLKLRERHIQITKTTWGCFQDFQLLSDRSVERNLGFCLTCNWLEIS